MLISLVWFLFPRTVQRMYSVLQNVKSWRNQHSRNAKSKAVLHASSNPTLANSREDGAPFTWESYSKTTTGKGPPAREKYAGHKVGNLSTTRDSVAAVFRWFFRNPKRKDGAARVAMIASAYEATVLLDDVFGEP